MTEVFQDKVALVTGATRGIGRAVTTGLLDAGCSVVGVYRSSDYEAKSLADQYPSFLPAKFDLSNVGEIDSLVSGLPPEFSTVDILVNNAGIKQRVGFFDTTPQVWDEVMAVNLGAPFLYKPSRKEWLPGAPVGLLI